MTRIITGTASVDPGGSIVTAWSNTDGVTLSEIKAPADSAVVIEGRSNFIKSRLSTTSFELMLPHTGDGGVGLACGISALTAGEAQIGTLNARTATVIQQLGVLDANGRGLFYNLIGATGDNDPGPGRMAFNNADPELVTELYLDVLDANEGGRDVSGLVGLWEPGTALIVRSIASTAYAAFRLVAAPAEAGGYRRISVEAVGSDGTLAAEPVGVEWLISGSGMEIGAVGPFAERSAFSTETHPFVYASVDGDGATITTSVLFQKRSIAPEDWSAPLPFQGLKGDPGLRGWAMVFASIPDGERRVERLIGYTGGEGAAPSYGIGLYRGIDGLVVDITDATDLRGARGPAGTIDGLTPFMQQRVTEDESAADTRLALDIVLAEQAAAEAGENNTEFMTPLRTAQAILALSPPSDTSDLDLTVSMLALLMADNSNIALFLGPTGNRVADSFDALTYVDVAGATNLDTSVAGVLKPTRLTSLIPHTVGTNFGDMTAAGGLNAAFDGVTSQGSGASAVRLSSTIAYVGKNYASATVISQVVVYPSTDVGFIDAGGTTNFTLQVFGKMTAPANSTDGTQIGILANQADSLTSKTIPVTSATAWPYMWVTINANDGSGSTNFVFAEVQFFTTLSNNLTVRSAAFVAATAPTKMKALIRVKVVNAAVAGTDYTMECSRDGGATWSIMTLTEMYVAGGLLYVDGGETSVAGQPSGAAPRWRFKTLNNKNVELHDVYLYWS